MNLLLKGRVDAKGAQIAALDLTANDKQHLKLSGQVDWHSGLSAEAKVDWLDFPWHNLYPVIAKPDVDLRTLNGEVSYTDGKYLGNLKADLIGPAGAFSVSSPFSGDLEKIFRPLVCPSVAAHHLDHRRVRHRTCRQPAARLAGLHRTAAIRVA